MNAIDIVILIFGICLFLTLSGYFIYRKVTNKGSLCADCDHSHKGQRLLKEYHKAYKDGGSNCHCGKCSGKGE